MIALEVHPNEAARVRHQLHVDDSRSANEIARAAGVDVEVVFAIVTPNAVIER